MTPSTRKNAIAYLFLAPYLSSFSLFILLPFAVSAVLSVLQYDLTSTAHPKFIGLRNFAEALTDPYFWKAVRATALYAILMVPSMIAVGLLLALGLNAMMRGRNLARAALFLPAMLNVAVVGIVWQWFYNRDFGLFNHLLSLVGIGPISFISSKLLAMPAIVLMSLWWSVGGTAVIFLTGLQQIPASIFEAAAIDGATAWQRFWRVTLPQLQPVLFFVITVNTIAAFQVFGQPFILTKGGPELFTRGIVQYIYETAFNQYRMGYGAALSWLLFALVGTFTLIQRYITRKLAN